MAGKVKLWPTQFPDEQVIKDLKRWHDEAALSGYPHATYGLRCAVRKITLVCAKEPILPIVRVRRDDLSQKLTTCKGRDLSEIFRTFKGDLHYQPSIAKINTRWN